MTVKATLAYGKSFHFYHEANDNNHVYIELEDVAYHVGYRRVMVAIPIDVWEVIRNLAPARLNLINISDEELIRLVEDRVEERLEEYAAAKSATLEEATRIRFNDSSVFGAMDSPREQQIARGIEYYRTERERQREVLSRISQHKILDINTRPPDADSL